MPIEDYDETSEEDIVRYAKGLIRKSLAEAVSLPSAIKVSTGKGRLGNLVEKYYFGIEPNSFSEPDFPLAKLELKVTGLKRTKGGQLQAKERLSLTLINFMELVSEKFESSSLLSKCERMLILCYEYLPGTNEIDLRFTPNQFVHVMTEHDIDQIRRDWLTIQQIVADGRAHELSEGDTFYLKASRKGAGKGRDATPQPFSDLPANRRGFSFSQGYLTSLIAAAPEAGSLSIVPGQTFEQATSAKLRPYLGRSKDELVQEFDANGASKSVVRTLVERMLTNGHTSVKELKAAGIQLKIVNLKANGKARESMSFSPFDYGDVLATPWEESGFAEALERKFLLAVFQADVNGVERFVKFGYWNMPFSDRQEAEKVYGQTQSAIKDGTYVLPGIAGSTVAHVRPHGRDSRDVVLCPDGEYRMKKSFWLNQRYIEKVVANL